MYTPVPTIDAVVQIDVRVISVSFAVNIIYDLGPCLQMRARIISNPEKVL